MPYYYHLDHLGTPWYITDRNKTIVWRGEYYPYGELYYEQANTTAFPANWPIRRPTSTTTGTGIMPLGSADTLRPKGRLPILLAAWGAYEIGSAIWDAWNAAEVLLDDCASREARYLALGGFFLSIIGPGGGYGSVAVKAEGQLHHAISRGVFNALESHPNLAGLYRFRDARLYARAKDLAANNGYQKWHVALDAEIADWIGEHQDATRATFQRYLRMRYTKPDLIEHFPHGLHID